MKRRILKGMTTLIILVGLVLVAAAFCICLISLGLALLGVARSIMQLNAFANLGAMVLAGIGGALAPISALPAWAAAIAPLTPSYWAMRGFRRVILEGGGALSIARPVLVLMTFSAVFLVIAARRFRYDDTKTSFA